MNVGIAEIYFHHISFLFLQSSSIGDPGSKKRGCTSRDDQLLFIYKTEQQEYRVYSQRASIEVRCILRTRRDASRMLSHVLGKSGYWLKLADVGIWKL